MQQGTALVLCAIAGLDDAGPDDGGWPGDSLLPGWDRKHVAAHLAANADALGNLVTWARTGRPTPMYASPAGRADGIAEGAARPGPEISAWLRESAAELSESLDRLSDEQWLTPVVTAQGRTVPATELPWMRAREVCVHAVDLATGVTFDDLPADFLAELCAEVAPRLSRPSAPAVVLNGVGDREFRVDGVGEPVRVKAPLATLAAYLTGRAGARTVGGAPAPALPAWL